MFLIWRGEGWAVLLVLSGALAAMVLSVELFVPGGARPEFFSKHAWPFALTFGVAGAVILVWGLATNHRSARAAIDVETGLSVVRRVRHSLYFIPVEYWGAAFLSGAVAFLLLRPI
jgi:hypothetical protein